MKTKVFMIHDVRDDYKAQYNKRYDVPYFFSKKNFSLRINELIKKYGKNVFDNSSLLNSIKTLDYILTFDDGLKDHLWVARTLNELGLKAIFFIPSAIFDKKTFVDSHKIQFLLSVCGEDYISYEILERIEPSIRKDVLRSYSKSLWKNNIWSPNTIFCTRFFRSYTNNHLRRSLLNELFELYVLKNDPLLHEKFYLSNVDLNEIKDLGHIIGSHGYESLNFDFEAESVIQKEIEASNIFSETNSKYKLYAFANGGFNKFSNDYLIKSNFSYLFTTIPKEWDGKDILVPRLDFSKTL